MIPASSNPTGTIPAAPPAPITCPSCRTVLAVDPSIGLEGPCPICSCYLRATTPVPVTAASSPFAAAPSATTGPPTPIKPAPRQVPGGPPRLGVPTAKEPVFDSPSYKVSPQPHGKAPKMSGCLRRIGQFFGSPGGKMTLGAIMMVTVLAIISGLFALDHQRSTHDIEGLLPTPAERAAPRQSFTEETAPGPAAATMPVHAEGTPLAIPGPIEIGDQ